MKETLSLYKGAKEVMRAGGFSLRKWKTEYAELAREIKKIENFEGREKKSYPGLNESNAKKTFGVPSGTINDKGKYLD